MNKEELTDKIAEAIKEMKSEDIVQAMVMGHTITTLVNWQTGKEAGLAAVLTCSTKFEYTEAVFNRWKQQIGADEFYILTDVPKVYINFRKENEKALDTITIDEAKRYLEEGQFAEGSMAPKIRAGIMFLENGGKQCVITEAGQLENPYCGTRIVRS